MKLAVRAALLTLVLILQVLVCCSSEDRQSKDNDGHDQNADLVVKTIKRPKKCEVKAKPGDSLRVHYVGRLGDRKGKVSVTMLVCDQYAHTYMLCDCS